MLLLTSHIALFTGCLRGGIKAQLLGAKAYYSARLEVILSYYSPGGVDYVFEFMCAGCPFSFSRPKTKKWRCEFEALYPRNKFEPIPMKSGVKPGRK